VQLFSTIARYQQLDAEVARRVMDTVKADSKRKSVERENLLKYWEQSEKQSRSNADEHLAKAVGILRQAVKLDPTDAPLHFQLAEMLNRVGNHDACREEAQEALRLHDLSTHPPRRLSDPQLSQVATWINPELRR
jgi:hypothetical protein